MYHIVCATLLFVHEFCASLSIVTEVVQNNCTHAYTIANKMLDLINRTMKLVQCIIVSLQGERANCLIKYGRCDKLRKISVLVTYVNNFTRT